MNDEYDILVGDNNQKLSDYIPTDFYLDENEMSETESGDMAVSFRYVQPLSSDLDIFEDLPDSIIRTMPRVSKFLDELRLSIVNNVTNLKDIHYNKLTLEETSHPGELMIDWIYNYFRAFFSFDDNEGDMYGLIVNNTETKQFISEFQALKETEYDAIAAKSVGFITENLLR